MAVSQQIEGLRTLAGNASRPIWEDWRERDFLTKEEGKNIKTAHTYLLKFINSVLGRISDKEKSVILKQMAKFDFKIVDDYTLQKLFRDMSDRMQNAAVPRREFEDWCCEIMECNCKNCYKHWDGCQLYKVFEDNFVPDGGYDLENCKYSYSDLKEVAQNESTNSKGTNRENNKGFSTKESR